MTSTVEIEENNTILKKEEEIVLLISVLQIKILSLNHTIVEVKLLVKQIYLVKKQLQLFQIKVL